MRPLHHGWSPSTTHLSFNIDIDDGHTVEKSGLPDLLASLNLLTTSEGMIEQCLFGPHPLLHLSYLRIHFNGWGADRYSRGRILPIIQHTFPNITSLGIDIRNYSLGFFLLVARTLPM